MSRALLRPLSTARYFAVILMGYRRQHSWAHAARVAYEIAVLERSF